ncbi:MAG: T9SS type A sorting domain-containing protein, partial [Ignavibacteriaceae bacterium]|nr:T9SS type A sorting domain-containing protein [Ignavibacteriaceae bacterium]
SFGEGQGVRLVVYDILGNEIATLVNEIKQAGSYEIELNTASLTSRSGSVLTSGIYFYTIQVGNYTETKKNVDA